MKVKTKGTAGPPTVTRQCWVFPSLEAIAIANCL